MLPLLALLTAIAGTADPDPLAPARHGKLQCYAPDIAAKTCHAIAGYVLQTDGSYLNTAHVLVDSDQGIALEAVSVVWVKGGAVCGLLSSADTLAGKVSIDGVPLPADQAAPILGQINAGYAAIGMLDKEVCTTYVPEGDHLRAEVTVDGVAQPEFNQPVIWISPADGYRLGK